ncbi:MAG: hypothetical protein HUK04_00270 [Bacteroidaceae bacterium]|nr:hypothetical protein [Bacteroidaceae bacterium]
MISISNADRDKAVEYIRAYADSLAEAAQSSTRMYNVRRMARHLADKLDRKQPESAQAKPSQEQRRPEK